MQDIILKSVEVPFSQDMDISLEMDRHSNKNITSYSQQIPQSK